LLMMPIMKRKFPPTRSLVNGADEVEGQSGHKREAIRFNGKRQFRVREKLKRMAPTRWKTRREMKKLLAAHAQLGRAVHAGSGETGSDTWDSLMRATFMKIERKKKKGT